jgi:RNA polymerase sigma-70 factor (ECF subfamily)
LADQTTDEALVARAAGGDEAAFLALYERHRDAIFRFAYRLLGAPALAEDIAHDCFLGLLRRPAAFDPARASLRTYLYAAARNLVLKQFRRPGVEVTLEDLHDELHAEESEQPLRRLLAAEVSEAVRRAVLNLPPLQREALVLFEYEELTLAEIAAVVGADVGAVKARLARARENLRRQLAPYMPAARREGER